MLLVIKLIKLDAFAYFNDVSYIEGLQDPFSFSIVYALIAIKSAIFGLNPSRKDALSLPI